LLPVGVPWFLVDAVWDVAGTAILLEIVTICVLVTDLDVDVE
jgi:hypothetical protein